MLLGALADDLTGAADVVAPFAGKLSTGVGVLPSAVLSGGQWEVWAWNTETRDLGDLALVAERVGHATEKILACEPKILFKKIDSTLRGNLSWELEVVRRQTPFRVPLICPAFPAMGRTVQDGRLYINGVCWTETEFAPLSRIATVADAFGTMFEDAVYADAVTESDMMALAQRVLRQPQKWLVVGSAGFSRAIARQFEIDSGTTVSSFAGRVLVIVGSRHARSREQVDHFCEVTGAVRLWIDSNTNRAEIVGQIRRLWERGAREVVLQTANDTLDASPNETLKKIVVSLYYQDCPFETLFATGGDTAIQIAEALGATFLRVLGERQTGVVVSLLKLRLGQSITLITKAGGFGNRETITRCFQREVRL